MNMKSGRSSNNMDKGGIFLDNNFWPQQNITRTTATNIATTITLQ